MFKKEFSYLLSFHINIPIQKFEEILEAIELYNANNGLELDNKFIRLFYDNKHFELKTKSFVGRGRRISLNKAKSLLLSNKATLYLGNETLLLKQKCIVKDKQILLFADDMFYIHKKPFKDITYINNEISTIMALTEYFKGELVFTGELSGDDNILVCYKDGEELHNIENKCPICEKIYTEYKIDMIYCKEGFNITFVSHIESNEKTLIAEDVFLSSVLQSMNQYGSDIIVYENTEMSRIDFILHNIDLSEIIYHNLKINEIKVYEKETTKYRNTLKEYETEKYIKYFDIGLQAMNENSLKNYFNFTNLYQRMNNMDFLVNIKQVEEDVVLNFYSPKFTVIPKEELMYAYK